MACRLGAGVLISRGKNKKNRSAGGCDRTPTRISGDCEDGFLSSMTESFFGSASSLETGGLEGRAVRG